MKGSDFENRLARLRGATTLAAARMVVRELRPHAGRMSAPIREEFGRLIIKHGLPLPTFPSVELRVGEAWLLLYDPSLRDGCTGRLRARFDGAPAEAEISPEVQRAHRGLLATAAQACRDLGQPIAPKIDFETPYGCFEIEGASLGLSVAIAALSAASGRVPAANVAGSAQVDDYGRLRRVEHLAPKLKALHLAWPEVTEVVVAAGQDLPASYESPVRLVPLNTLAQAISRFGMSLDALPAATLDEYVNRVSGFAVQNGRNHSAAEWSTLSAMAWEASVALAGDRKEESAKAALWAALFAVHSGDPSAANAMANEVPDSVAEDFPELLARKLITNASSKIDQDDFQAAIDLAARATMLCNEKLPTRDRNELLGQAVGTEGRGWMHLGDHHRAEACLRRSLEHYRCHVGQEAPRSACYLATCLRLQGNLQDAREVAEEALTAVDADWKRWALAATTRTFLRLERGRIRAALGQWEGAIEDFVFVGDEQVEDTAYPRLAAVRGLAGALRALARYDEADEALEACLRVAQEVSNQSTLRRVAAMAAGDALIDVAPTQVPTPRLQNVWDATFPNQASPAQIAATISAWIY